MESKPPAEEAKPAEATDANKTDAPMDGGEPNQGKY